MQGQTNPSSPIQAGSVENSGPGEGLPLVTEPNPTTALGWQFLNQIGSGLLGFGANLASVYSPGFFPLVGIAGGWPEPGNPITVQEVSQRLALAEYLKASDCVILAVKATSEQRSAAGKSALGSSTHSSTALGFLSEEDDGASIRIDDHDLIVAARFEGLGCTRSSTQMNDEDPIIGSNGPRYAARSNSSPFILAAPRLDGVYHTTSAPTWKLSNGQDSTSLSCPETRPWHLILNWL
ncbi:hypothetical protein NL676_011716 [Syzygium grande]|nr:hypothetical protein NL676_011716 [Syzygium grande]